jgi:hypothetical protein
MSHIHWVVRQNKLEIPRDEDDGLFIMNQESESERQDLYMSVGPMKDQGLLSSFFLGID